MTKKDVAQIVQRYLQAQEHPEGITSRVQEQGIHRQGGFWYVPFLPSAEPHNLYAYFEVLAEVETLLDENDHLDILFVPLIGEEVAAAA